MQIFVHSLNFKAFNNTYILVRGRIKETTQAFIQLNPSTLGFNWIYTRRQWLRDAK